MQSTYIGSPFHDARTAKVMLARHYPRAGLGLATNRTDVAYLHPRMLLKKRQRFFQKILWLHAHQPRRHVTEERAIPIFFVPPSIVLRMEGEMAEEE